MFNFCQYKDIVPLHPPAGQPKSPTPTQRLSSSLPCFLLSCLLIAWLPVLLFDHSPLFSDFHLPSREDTLFSPMLLFFCPSRAYFHEFRGIPPSFPLPVDWHIRTIWRRVYRLAPPSFHPLFLGRYFSRFLASLKGNYHLLRNPLFYGLFFYFFRILSHHIVLVTPFLLLLVPLVWSPSFRKDLPAFGIPPLASLSTTSSPEPLATFAI